MSLINDRLIELFPSKIDGKAFVGGSAIGVVWLPIICNRWIWPSGDPKPTLLQQRFEPGEEVEIILADEEWLYIHAINDSVAVSSGVFEKFRIKR